MYQPRWYQVEAENAIFNYFASGKKGNPVVAMPTGTGKSVVVGSFIQNIFRAFPRQRVMMLTHVKNLIDQNAEKLVSLWPTAPIGIYSAGLNSRDIVQPIIFGGVQSVAKAIERAVDPDRTDPNSEIARHFGHRDLIIVDECHLIDPESSTRYQYVISELRKINPFLKIIGFTATPYRMGQGLIVDGGVFTDVCYDLTEMKTFNRLVREGFLAPLVPCPVKNEFDLSGVGLVGGEFNKKQLEEKVTLETVLYAGVKEMVEYGHDRNSWLVFASGVKQAEMITEMIRSFGISVEVIHSKINAKQNDRVIEDFKSGKIRCLVNSDKLTTGFDHPPMDLIGMFRATMSTALWVQMLGRGTRPSPNTGKMDCMVLDFAGNTKRLGPINDPVIPKKKGAGGGSAPVRTCPKCDFNNHASAKECANCGHVFEVTTKVKAVAATLELIRSEEPVYETFTVKKVIYGMHQKRLRDGTPSGPPSIKATYFAGAMQFNEWVCIEHTGFAARKARQWWMARAKGSVPKTVAEALSRIDILNTPLTIKVITNRQYPEIAGIGF